MKAHVIFLMLLSLVCFNTYAQDDDMYSFSSKKKESAKATAASVQNSSQSTYSNRSNATADYHIGQLRDVDEYNRRGYSQPESTSSYRLQGDTLYVSTNDQALRNEIASYDEGYSDGYSDGFYDGDFTYTTRLARYRGFRYYDPLLFNITFGWYDPWYDPWYGWNGPYYRYGYTGWYSWGWHYNGWHYGWHHPHHYGGYYYSGRTVPYRHSTTSRGSNRRSATYIGRANTDRSAFSRSSSRAATMGRARTGDIPSRSGSTVQPSRGSGMPSRSSGVTTSRSSSYPSRENVSTSRSGGYNTSRSSGYSTSRSSGYSTSRSSGYSGGGSSRSGGFSGGGSSRSGGFSGGGSRGGGSRGGGGRR